MFFGICNLIMYLHNCPPRDDLDVTSLLCRLQPQTIQYFVTGGIYFQLLYIKLHPLKIHICTKFETD